MTGHALWSALAARGLVEGDAPPAATPRPPWYLRGLLGFAAWVASWFVLASIGALSWRLLETAAGAMLVGALLCGAAAFVLRQGERQAFVEQLALAISFAGQASIAYGLFQALGPKELAPLLAIAAFEAVMVVAIPHRMHRAMCTLFACTALYAALMFGPPRWPLPVLIAGLFAWFALAADRSARANAWGEPISTGLALALCAYAPFAPWIQEMGMRDPPWSNLAWLEGVLLALVLAGVVIALVRRGALRDGHARAAIGIATVALAALAWPVPGLIASLIVVIVAFAMARPVLVGVGIVSAVWMLGFYYYSMQTSLFTKSMSLAAAGCVLLAAGLVLPRLIEGAGANVARGAGPASATEPRQTRAAPKEAP